MKKGLRHAKRRPVTGAHENVSTSRRSRSWDLSFETGPDDLAANGLQWRSMRVGDESPLVRSSWFNLRRVPDISTRAAQTADPTDRSTTRLPCEGPSPEIVG